MKTIILATICASVVAASSLPAAAAGDVRKSRHTATATSQQVSDARASVFSPQTDLSYGSSRSYGWSAPAGR